MAEQDIREQIELAGITLGYALIAYSYGAIHGNIMDCYRDSYVEDILFLTISRDRKCGSCEGTGLIGGPGINDRCDDCKGTGSLPIETKAVNEILEEWKR